MSKFAGFIEFSKFYTQLNIPVLITIYNNMIELLGCMNSLQRKHWHTKHLHHSRTTHGC